MIYFLLGLFLGSFLNNVAYRLVRKEKFIWERSKCPYCRKILNWYELIPLLSYLIQKGKCRNCQKKISLRYPLSELIAGFFTYQSAKLSGILYAFNLLNFLNFLYLLSFISLFFILALYDYETFYIEDNLFYSLLLLFFIFQFLSLFFNLKEFHFSSFNYFFSPQVNFFDKIFRAYLSMIFIFLLFILTIGKGIGLGDAKLAFLLGLYLNFGDLLLILFLASLIGSILGVIKIIKNKKIFNEVPFIPLLFFAFLIVLWGGDNIYEIFNKFVLKLN